MFTVPSNIERADMRAGLQRFEYDGNVYRPARAGRLKSGARYGCSAVFVATGDLSRILANSVNSTDAKDESMDPLAQPSAPAALK